MCKRRLEEEGGRGARRPCSRGGTRSCALEREGASLAGTVDFKRSNGPDSARATRRLAPTSAPRRAQEHTQRTLSQPPQPSSFMPHSATSRFFTRPNNAGTVLQYHQITNSSRTAVWESPRSPTVTSSPAYTFGSNSPHWLSSAHFSGRTLSVVS